MKAETCRVTYLKTPQSVVVIDCTFSSDLVFMHITASVTNFGENGWEPTRILTFSVVLMVSLSPFSQH